MNVGYERHPWNTSFTWSDHAGPFRIVTAEQARSYDTDGYFVISDAVDVETVDAVVDALAPLDQEVVDFLRTQPGGRFSIAGVDTVSIALHPSMRSPVLRDFCAAPLFADLCLDLIGPDARLYWDQSVFKKGHSAEPVLWHQDNGYTYVEPQAYLTCWVALTDATEENGCVWVMQGIHREGTLAHRDTPIGFECFTDEEAKAAGAVPVPVRAGSVVVFSSLTPHATGYNRTDEERKAYILQYAPDGAVAYRGDPSGSPGPAETQNDPVRQFLVARDGEQVEP
ncbi:MAG: phytanoyl-CoA dioxygenase family protein [Acidimicrobiia bacterium]